MEISHSIVIYIQKCYVIDEMSNKQRILMKLFCVLFGDVHCQFE